MRRVGYRLLLRLLPAWFRARHGEAMAAAFGEAREAARARGRGAVLGLWLRETVDVTRTGVRLRRGPAPTTGGAGMGGRGTGGGGVTGAVDDLRYAARSLVRNPGYALFAWATLALGIGATTAIFSAVRAVLIDPVPLEDGDRIAHLWRPMGGGSYLMPGPEQLEAWAREADVFEAVEPMGSSTSTLSAEEGAVEVQTASVRPSALPRLGAVAVLGRTFTEEEAGAEPAQVALLGHAMWRSRFGGDRGVIGRILTLDGKDYTVVGVAGPDAAFPGFSGTRVDVWLPLPGRDVRTGNTAWLAEGVTVDEANRRLALVAERAVADGAAAEDWAGEARLLSETIGSSMRDPLRVLMGAVVLLLLIACGNVANLLLSRAHVRAHESAVRLAVGAARARIFRQHLLESLLLGLASAGGGLLLALGAIRALNALRPARLTALEAVTLDGAIVLFAVAVATASAVLFGTAPAWRALRSALPLEALRSGRHLDGSGAGGGRTRFALIAVEVALSFALLVGATMLVRSLVDLQRTDPGFESEGLLFAHVRLPSWKHDEAGRAEVLARMAERLAGLGPVETLSRSLGAPGSAGITFGKPQVEGGAPSEETVLFQSPFVDEAWFDALGMGITEGRGFTADEVRDGSPVYVLGEGAARRLFPDGDAVGGRFRLGEEGDYRTVVGVVPDAKLTGLSAASGRLQLYAPVRAEWANADFALRVRPGVDPRSLADEVRAVLLAEEPDVRIDHVLPAGTVMGRTIARERFVTSLLAAFAALALALSAVGLYGVVSQVVGQRRREIGIRVSLGARAADVHSLVLAGGARATGAGLLAGGGLAALGHRLLENRLFGLESAGPGAYGTAALALALAAAAACWLPARRAARVDPVEALRAD